LIIRNALKTRAWVAATICLGYPRLIEAGAVIWAARCFLWARSKMNMRAMWRTGLAVLVSAMVAGCNATPDPVTDAVLSPKDRKLLANAPYARATSVPDFYQRHVVSFTRPEKPGTVVVDTDARFLYLVQEGGKALRYGVTVGEEGLAFSGRARVGRKAEWPSWTPTPEIKARLDVPNFVAPGPHNPMGARALYLYQGNRDTLFRIHGTNQPEFIGQAISSGCIRMTNEDVIDLFKRVPVGAEVVVLGPGEGNPLDNPNIRSAQAAERSAMR
jgi:lipoprotein-anchoring transpeptidase ErfK/SrfK